MCILRAAWWLLFRILVTWEVTSTGTVYYAEQIGEKKALLCGMRTRAEGGTSRLLEKKRKMMMQVSSRVDAKVLPFQ